MRCGVVVRGQGGVGGGIGAQSDVVPAFSRVVPLLCPCCVHTPPPIQACSAWSARPLHIRTEQEYNSVASNSSLVAADTIGIVVCSYRRTVLFSLV